MAWVWLGIATVFEIVFALGTNASEGFTRLWSSVVAVVAGIGAVIFLSLSLTDLDVGVAYTVWTGLGATGTVLLGALLFGEKLTLKRAGCFAVILAGVIGLQFTGAA